MGLRGPGLDPLVMGQLGGASILQCGGGGTEVEGVKVEVGSWLKACGVVVDNVVCLWWGSRVAAYTFVVRAQVSV